MIGWLKGSIIDNHQPGKLVIEVQGVGYDVETSLQTFFQIQSQETVGLHIHMVVREDALTLYGFCDLQERALFRALIKVNGIGPKSAIAILSSLKPDEFIQCIHQQNTLSLTKLPGIGQKTAQRLLIELRDNLPDLSPLHINMDSTQKHSSLHEQDEAIKALMALGYPQHQATQAVKQIGGELNCEQLIRQSLQLFCKN